MKKLLLAPALLCAAMSAQAQLALENFNAAGTPAGWSMITDANKVTATGLPTWLVTNLNARAWAKYPLGGGDSTMISSSNFTPAGTADRWLITPPFTVTSASTFISWDDAEFTSAGASPIEVLVSTTGGATAADFTTSLGTTTCSPGYFVTRGYSLSAFNGMSIRVAFRNKGAGKGFPAIDNVKSAILPAAELQLLSATPATGSLGSYGVVGSSVPVGITVQNNGANTVTSFVAKYQVGSSPVVSETKTGSILPFGKATFSFTTPITLASSTTPVKIWVELPSDVDNTNDSTGTTVGGFNAKPTKKILAEEPTGTWCGYCVRGIIYMDSIHKEHPENFSLVAVHNADPMVLTAYDAYIGTMIGGYPSLVADRRIVADPSDLFDIYASENESFGLADIALTPAVSGTSLSVDVAVTPIIDVKSEYRLALVLTEDDVKGTASGYIQTNYYSGGSLGDMHNAEFDFASLPAKVPAAQMNYDYVARLAYPSPTGAVGSLPLTMSAGTTYNYTFSGITLSSAWNVDKMKAVVMLINTKDGSVLNTQNVRLVPVSVKDVAAGINQMEVYPNPAANVVNAKFTLTEASSVSVDVVDLMGKTVKSIAGKNMTAGSYEVPVNVSALASGIYMVKITTDKGNITQRVSIVK